jgi:hypothetical protein
VAILHQLLGTIWRKRSAMGRKTNDLVGLFDRYCSHNISSKLETRAHENNDEVVRFILQERLVELYGCWDGIEDREDDGDGEMGVGGPD